MDRGTSVNEGNDKWEEKVRSFQTHDAYASDDEDDPLKRTPKMENDGNATVLRAPVSYYGRY